MGIDLNEFRETFFIEAAEHLDAMEAALLQLDHAPNDRELLNTIFRAAHTIKGGSATFGMHGVSRFTHVVENLLDRLREGSLSVTERLVELLFSSVDVIQALIAAERDGSPLPDDLDSILTALQAIHLPESTSPQSAVDSSSPPQASTAQVNARPEVTGAATSPRRAESENQKPERYEIHFQPSTVFFRSGQDPLLLIRELAELGILESSVLNASRLPELPSLDPEECHVGWKLQLSSSAGLSALEDVFMFIDDQSKFTIRKLEQTPAPLPATGLPASGDSGNAPAGSPNTIPPSDPSLATNLAAMTKSDSSASKVTAPANTADTSNTAGVSEKRVATRGATPGDNETVRVDRRRLDDLINQIGELVIGVSMVEREVAAVSGGNESSAMMQLGKIVRDLQELSLSLRMVPIAATFQKMARVVHDISRKLGKQVELITAGDDTELDKSVVDKIGDPLIHMVRNAVDHGIELPEVRVAGGKPAVGRVSLRAFQQGGNIFIELSDDGRGLNRAAIIAKALERGVVTSGDNLSDADICNLIFQPGFSTAKEITDISGRGVGMDVVRRNVEELQGNVQVRSMEGKGSTMTVRLPLTLAILDGLLVQVRGEVYVIPLLSVVESISIEPQDIRQLVSAGQVIMLRGEVVPVIWLSQLLQGEQQQSHEGKQLLVIVEEQGRRMALVVDELIGQQQVVIKNLEANFRKVPGVAGATILGDGCVALILDMYGIACMYAERANLGSTA